MSNARVPNKMVTMEVPNNVITDDGLLAKKGPNSANVTKTKLCFSFDSPLFIPMLQLKYTISDLPLANQFHNLILT